MRKVSISFNSKGLSLEGVLTTPTGQASLLPAAVLCHPHPLFGGSMENSVVVAIASALNNSGIATLRFNFRGVGESQGFSTQAVEEQNDIRAALQVVQRWKGIDKNRLALVGYSFGAQVILKGLKKYKASAALVLVSPPLSSFKGNLQTSTLKDIRVPNLFVVGDCDRLVKVKDLKEQIASIHPHLEPRIIAGADHSWKGHEQDVANCVAEFLRGTL
jgi:alpha/beta superfamily hydrolase